MWLTLQINYSIVLKFCKFSHSRSDMKLIVLILAHTNTQFVNVTVNLRDLRTPLHLACAIGNLAISQLLIWVSLSIVPILNTILIQYCFLC